MSLKQYQALKEYWRKVKAGELPRPERKSNGETRKRVRVISSWVKGSELIVTIYPHGEIGFKEPRRRDQYRLSTAEAYRQAVIITVAKIKARVKELRKAGHSRGAAQRLARKEIIQ